MKKPPTRLDKVWNLCLAMWKDIAESVEGLDNFNDDTIVELKIQWLKDHHYNPDILCHFCFFCEYAQERMQGCVGCPGRLVENGWACGKTATICWYCDPIGFYKELLRLNQIRTAAKGNK